MDCVIDTNVFEHSHNPSDKHYDCASRFLMAFRDSGDLAYFDVGNRIVQEYKTRLGHFDPASLCLSVLAQLLRDHRYQLVDTNLEPQEVVWLNSQVTGRVDRIMARVARNSLTKSLVSNDGDLNKYARNGLRSRWKVVVRSSCEV